MEITKEEINCEECGLPLLYSDKPCPSCNNINFKKTEIIINFLNKHKKSLIIFVTSISVVVFSLFFWIPQTPEYSIYMMVDSVKNQDIDTFKEYVDINKVANTYVDDALNYARPHGSSWANNLANSFMELMRPQLVSYISTQLENFINNPENFNVKPKDINLQKIAEMLIIKHSKDINISIKNQGDNIRTFTIENKLNKVKFGLKLSENKAKHRYIVVAIDSEDLFNKLKK